MSAPVELLMSAVAGDVFRSVGGRQLELRKVVEGVEASSFDFSVLIEIDAAVEEVLVNASDVERRVFSFFCNVSVGHSVMRARERVNFLLWGLVDGYDVVGLEVESSEVLVNAVQECEFFVPSLLSCGAFYLKP